MPPQPLSSVNRRARVRWGPGTLAERQGLATSILEAIAAWSEAEVAIATLFAALIEAEYTPATAAFFALTSGPGQLAAMDAFAEEFLDGDALDVFRAIVLIYRRRRKVRNDLAHWRYAVSDDIPDAVLLMDQAKHKWVESKHLDAYRRKMSGMGQMTTEQEESINLKVLSSIYVYKHKNIVEIRDNAIETMRSVEILTLALECRHFPPGRDQALRELLEIPTIREEVEKRRSSDRASP